MSGAGLVGVWMQCAWKLRQPQDKHRSTVVGYVSCDKAENLCLEVFALANCSNSFISLPLQLYVDIVICAYVSIFFCSDTSFPVEEQMRDQMASSGALPLHSAIDSSRRTGLIKSHCLAPSSNHRETGTDGSVAWNTRIPNSTHTNVLLRFLCLDVVEANVGKKNSLLCYTDYRKSNPTRMRIMLVTPIRAIYHTGIRGALVLELVSADRLMAGPAMSANSTERNGTRLSVGKERDQQENRQQEVYERNPAECWLHHYINSVLALVTRAAQQQRTCMQICAGILCSYWAKG